MDGITFSASGGNIAENILASVVEDKKVEAKKSATAKQEATEAFQDFKEDTLDLIETYEYQIDNALSTVRDLVSRIKSQNLWDDISVMTEEEEIIKYVDDANSSFVQGDYEDEEKEMITDLMWELKDLSEELATYNTIMLSDESKAIENIKKTLEAM